MDNQLISRLYDAIDDAVNETVDKAEYNRTIQATIVKCIDATIGKYQCKYQDSNFYAYSQDVNTTYTDGSSVYILVPNNDLNGNKQIIGSVKKLGINYIRETEEENFYDINGTSCIDSKDKVFGLKSYQKEDNLILYSKEKNINEISVNQEAAVEYIKNSTSLMIETTIQTKLDRVQQFRGNYGIKFVLDFENNSDESIVTKEFYLDVDKIVGNPYKLISPTRQYAIFNIDYGKFQGVNTIEIYSKDFPNRDDEKPADIFFSNIKIFGANKMSQSEINGCSINFIFPQGTYFDKNNQDVDKTIKAQVKLKGVILDPTLQDIEFYWYREDIRTTLNSEYYNSWGGRGWRCLNQKTIVEQATETEPAVVEWIPSGDTFKITYNDAVASENVFKCVIKYDGRVFNKTFVIKNRNGVFSSRIEAAPGQEFSYDVGSPTLTCITTNPDNSTNDDLQYSWAMVDNEGLMIFLHETTEDNNKLKVAKDELKDIEDAIEKGELFLSAVQERIDELKNIIKPLEKAQRVDGKYVYNIDLTKINQQATFKCSIYMKSDTGETYLGTSSIIIKNTREQKQQCRLIINNGNQVFKYTEEGIAPTNKSLENPIDLKVLSYTIFDENGDEVPFEVAEKCQSKWKVPIKRTMLKNISASGEAGTIDEKGEYQFYKNTTMLSYKIEDKFNYNYDSNDIYLTVNYKGVNLYASTNFTFTKQGDIGTNGTDYVCKIELNTDQSYIKYPIISFDLTETDTPTFGKLNFTTVEEDGESDFISSERGRTIFKAKLYHNGEVVDDIVPSNISWKILQNLYGRSSGENIVDESYYNINILNGQVTLNSNIKKLQEISYPANLIQCQISYNGMYFYDVMPIFTCFYSQSDYTINLKENSGFEYVLYSSDGRNPKYNDEDPFEVIVNKKINGVYEDISFIKYVEGSQSEAVEFEWKTGGKVKRKNGTKWIDKELSDLNKITLKDKRTLTEDNLNKNKRYAIPPAEYDGECLNYCILVNINKSENNQLVGKIHIPIYLLLNRYGIASINQWDGNSVQIDEEGGYILAPQIGAGKKDNENRFTGVLMGEVREANRESSDIGLLGYDKGEKTFFLDSEDGSLMLGKKGEGRMYLGPSADSNDDPRALIYSDNFWQEYTEKGKPVSYSNNNEKGEGMLIDLTTPEIKFGKKVDINNDGKKTYAFRVNENGELTATKGTIANFIIDINKTNKPLEKPNDVDIPPKDSKEYLDNLCKWLALEEISEMNEIISEDESIYNDEIVVGKLYSGNKTDWSSKESGIYLDSIGRIAAGSNFKVNEYGDIIANFGKIANFHINIGPTEATKQPKEGDADFDPNDPYKTKWVYDVGKIYSDNKCKWWEKTKGIYIDSIGRIRLGEHFLVNEDGHLKATSATIGGFTVGEDRIYSGKKDDWTNPTDPNGLFLGSSGAIKLGNNFEVGPDGRLIARSGTIGGWNITRNSLWYGGSETNPTVSLNGNDGTAQFGSNFTISNTGHITSYSGTIGGWNIAKNSLYAGSSNNKTMYLNDNGSCGGLNWSISSAGYATFRNGFTTNGSYGTNSYGGGSLGGTLSGGSYTGGVSGASSGYGDFSVGGAFGNVSSRITAVEGQFNNLSVLDKLEYQGRKAKWVSVVSSITFDGSKAGLSLRVYSRYVVGDGTTHKSHSVDIPGSLMWG